MDIFQGDGTLVQAGYNPYSGASLTVATGAAAAPAASGILGNPVLWIILIIGAIVIARQ